MSLESFAINLALVLILDEVMSGFRASRLGSYPFHEVDADLVTFGKVIGGGMNVAAFGGKAKIMDCLKSRGCSISSRHAKWQPSGDERCIAAISKINSDVNLYAMT